MANDGYHVAIVGATGAVGTVMRELLEERNFPVASLRLLASSRSAGRTLPFRGEPHRVEELSESSFHGVDLVLSSAGGSVSKRFLPYAVKAGAVCIDNTSAFRMDPDVPLVVPEVNPHAALRHQGIIANPNCSTIQMVVALKPLHDAARVRRVVVSTYQGISGAGARAVEDAKQQIAAALDGKPIPSSPKFVHPIAFNCLPQISHGVGSNPFDEHGYTDEELKMIRETVKIMEDDSIRVTATTVRVPVLTGHSEAINVQTERKLTAQRARELLAKAPGIVLMDDPGHHVYPMPILAAGKDPVFVGRVREDFSAENALNLWVVADNLRKGAALNAVQIAELLVREGAL
ncbi:MAG: aspartate-semialdehyde dehydrogenase [Candidatus Poribacteria bacterium]|nr:MAG: aspartate-semialdehyde dehydrogenase [Candidatus Poribacteria bacterium]